MTSGSLWSYHNDEINDSPDKTDNNDNIINSNKRTTSKSFKYKTKIIKSAPSDNNI